MNLSKTDLEGYKKTLFCIFKKHNPIERKYIHANEAPFITKEPHEAITKRTELRNKSLKTRTLFD